MSCIRRLALVVAFVWLAGVAAQGPKPVPFPPVNAGAAKLEQTSAPLDTPALGMASDETAGVVLVAGEDGSVYSWPRDPATGLKLTGTSPRVLKGHEGPVLAIAAGGKTIASGGTDGKILLWAIPGDKVQQTLKVGSAVRALAVAPDGKRLASGGENGVQLWDAGSGKAVRKLDGPTDWVLAAAFSADGKRLAAGGYDGRVRVWDVGSGKKLIDVLAQPAPAAKAPPPPVNVVSAIAFSPDGKQFAVGGSDPRIHLFQATDGKLIRSLTGHTATVGALAFHPAGAVLISGSKDGTIRLWNPAGGQMLKSLTGHTAWVDGLALLERGTLLASTGADRTVRLWRLADAPKPMTKPPAKPKKKK